MESGRAVEHPPSHQVGLKGEKITSLGKEKDFGGENWPKYTQFPYFPRFYEKMLFFRGLFLPSLKEGRKRILRKDNDFVEKFWKVKDYSLKVYTKCVKTYLVNINTLVLQ